MSIIVEDATEYKFMADCDQGRRVKSCYNRIAKAHPVAVFNASSHDHMQSNALSTLLNSDIQDPTDFPNNEHAPGLRQLDAALRCDICSEFYEAPVTLTCGHCFCSLVSVDNIIRE